MRHMDIFNKTVLSDERFPRKTIDLISGGDSTAFLL